MCPDYPISHGDAHIYSTLFKIVKTLMSWSGPSMSAYAPKTRFHMTWCTSASVRIIRCSAYMYIHSFFLFFFLTFSMLMNGLNAYMHKPYQIATSENVRSDMCAQRRLRSACVFAQPDQNIHWTHFGQPGVQSFFLRTTKTLIRLRGWAGWLESSLGAHVRRGVFWRFDSYRWWHAGLSCSKRR